MKMKLALAALLLAGSAGAANAATYNIAMTGFCDTLTLTNSGGVVVGQSNASACDTGNLVGTQANVKVGGNPGNRELVVGGDLGLSPEVWVWQINLKTLTCTLVGSPDGVSVVGPLNFACTFTKAGAKSSGTRSAVSFAKSQQ